MNRSPAITFPRDKYKHDSGIEWWYFNGHLRDRTGGQYAFMSTLFRCNLRKMNLPFLRLPAYKEEVYFAHHIVSDIKKQKSYAYVKPACAVSGDSFKGKLFKVFYAPPLARRKNYASIAELKPDFYRVKNESLDLRLRSKKPPLLEGGTGLLKMNGAETYYYSLTDLETEGAVMIGGKRTAVKGKSWFDHQWSDAKISKVSWTWFSLQFKDDSEIVCFIFSNGENRSVLADMMFADSKTLHTARVEFINLKDNWTSPRTKAVYPLSWRIKIPEYRADLRIRPLIREQEILQGTMNYWEGPTAVEGVLRGKKVSGRGFLELVGYPIKEKLIKVLGGQIGETAKKGLSGLIGA